MTRNQAQPHSRAATAAGKGERRRGERKLARERQLVTKKTNRRWLAVPCCLPLVGPETSPLKGDLAV